MRSTSLTHGSSCPHICTRSFDLPLIYAHTIQVAGLSPGPHSVNTASLRRLYSSSSLYTWWEMRTKDAWHHRLPSPALSSAARLFASRTYARLLSPLLRVPALLLSSVTQQWCIGASTPNSLLSRLRSVSASSLLQTATAAGSFTMTIAQHRWGGAPSATTSPQQGHTVKTVNTVTRVPCHLLTKSPRTSILRVPEKSASLEHWHCATCITPARLAVAGDAKYGPDAAPQLRRDPQNNHRFGSIVDRPFLINLTPRDSGVVPPCCMMSHQCPKPLPALLP